MVAKCLTRQRNCLGDGVRIHAAPPLLHDGLPGNARSYLLKDIPYQNSGSPERRLAVADCRVGYDESPDDSLDCLPSGITHDASRTIIPGLPLQFTGSV
jgi:hypothetical protein